MTQPHGPVFDARQVRRAFSRASAGYTSAAALQRDGVPVDARPFAPHLTLGRKARGLVGPALPPVAWRSAGHVLALSAGGRYSVVTRFG